MFGPHSYHLYLKKNPGYFYWRPSHHFGMGKSSCTCKNLDNMHVASQAVEEDFPSSNVDPAIRRNNRPTHKNKLHTVKDDIDYCSDGNRIRRDVVGNFDLCCRCCSFFIMNCILIVQSIIWIFWIVWIQETLLPSVIAIQSFLKLAFLVSIIIVSFLFVLSFLP